MRSLYPRDDYGSFVNESRFRKQEQRAGEHAFCFSVVFVSPWLFMAVWENGIAYQRCLADEPTRNVSLLCRSGLGSKIDTQGFSALIYQLCGQ